MKFELDLDKINEEREQLAIRIKKIEDFLKLAKELGLEKTDAAKDLPAKTSPLLPVLPSPDLRWANSTFRDKIYMAINDAGRFVHVTEIVAIMKAHHVPNQGIDTHNDLQARVSAALTSLKSQGKLEKVSGDISVWDQYWGYSIWIEGNKIKPEFMFKKREKK